MIILEGLKKFNSIFWAVVSVFSLLTIHVLVLREALLGPLSPLADATFYSDLVFDIVWVALLSALFGRIVTLFYFTGPVQDHLSVSAAIFAKLKRVLRLGEEAGDGIVQKANVWFEDRLVLLETCITSVAFAFLYFGEQFGRWSIFQIIAVLGPVLLLFSHILVYLRVTKLQDALALVMSGNAAKVRLLFTLVAAALLLLSVGTALLRASEIAIRNIVSLQKS